MRQFGTMATKAIVEVRSLRCGEKLNQREGLPVKNENEDLERATEQNVSSSSMPLLAKVILFVIVGLILIGMLLPANQQIRGPHRRPPCQNNLRQLSLAMIHYESQHMHFLPSYVADENGKPMHSWRVLLLPYLEQQELYDRYDMDEPWDGPNNSKLHDEVVELYRCPNSSNEKNCTDYVLITGRGTAFDGGSTVNFGGVTDGSSNSILITEVFGESFHWMKPQDITVEQFVSTTHPKAKSNHEGARNVSLFDGSTYAVDLNAAPEELRKLATINDGQIVDINDSRHPISR